MVGKNKDPEAIKLINLLGYPAVLINSHGIITAINKQFNDSFFCSKKDVCHCGQPCITRKPKQVHNLCSSFFLSAMELFINYPDLSYTNFHQGSLKWKLTCKNFDKDVYLIFATNHIDSDEIAQKLKLLGVNYDNQNTIKKNKTTDLHHKLLEIPLAEFEKALNKAFFLIQDDKIIYANSVFKKEFNEDKGTTYPREIESILGRPVEFFKTISSSDFNYSPIEIDLPLDIIPNRSCWLLGRTVVFNEATAYAIVLEFIEKPDKNPKKIITHKSPNQNQEILNWDQIQIELEVLYVEDKVVNQKILRIMLENIGCKVDVASNGKEGIEKVKQNSYDIVFMDIQMPVMDGLTASRKILDLKNPPPIIAITANSEFLDSLELHEYGIKDYISKPVKTNELYEKLLYWVQ